MSLEHSDFEEQQENSGKQEEEEEGILEYNSTCDDEDIPSLEWEANSLLGRGSRKTITKLSNVIGYHQPE